MADFYDQLLDATIRHLEDLKARGVRFVPVARETLQQLSAAAKAPAHRASATRPAASEAAAKAKTSPSSPIAQTPHPGPLPIGWAEGERAPVGSLDRSDNVLAAAPQKLSSEAKAAAFEQLRARALACVKCPHLVAARNTVVFGVGNIDAELMFVGEAPGADEDRQGEPFVGAAGRLLTKIIQTMGLDRPGVYIANILKCRPDTPGQSTGNRKPTPEEMQTCIPYLHEQIDLIQPKVLVGLGGTAIEGLLGKTAGITRLRGQWQTYRGIPLMPTYHPAFLLRNQALSEKRRVWEDMLKVMEKLGLPISEKQRNFFLK